MGEVVKRSEEDQHDVEDSVLALSEAGWTHRDIAKELGVSKNSITTYRGRALERIPIPEHEETVRENIVQLRWVMDECKRRLRSARLPETSINVGNLLREYRMARSELNDELKDYRTQDSTLGGLTVLQLITHPDMADVMSMNTDQWAEVMGEEIEEAEIIQPLNDSDQNNNED